MTRPVPTIFMHSRSRTSKTIHLIFFSLFFASSVLANAQDDARQRRKYRIDHTVFQRRYGPFPLYLIIIMSLLAAITVVIAGWMTHATIRRKASKAATG